MRARPSVSRWVLLLWAGVPWSQYEGLVVHIHHVRNYYVVLTALLHISNSLK